MHRSIPYPKAFDDEETAVLRHAFAKAWVRLRWTHAKNAATDDALKAELAAAILEIASQGVADADVMAKLAVEQFDQTSSSQATQN